MFVRRLLKKIGIWKYLKTQASDKDLARSSFLNQIIPKGGVGAELGVEKGVFTRCLLDVTEPEKLHLIDPWYLLGREWHWGSGNRSTVDALIGILGAFKNDLVEGRIVLNIGYDLEILSTFPEQYLDWVYIDTTHQYEHTQKELELLKSKIKENGIIAGDDWQINPDHPHHGVCRAVNEFVKREPYPDHLFQ